MLYDHLQAERQMRMATVLLNLSGGVRQCQGLWIWVVCVALFPMFSMMNGTDIQWMPYMRT
jgi:hypothetical protein